MQLSRTSLVTEFRLEVRFNDVRGRLLGSPSSEKLNKPLAYWALPNDRRLPLAFMGRTLRELLETPFDELSATPGVGQKKMVALVHLLERAESHQETENHTFPIDLALAEMGASTSSGEPASEPFDASRVSEGVWFQWRECIKRCHLEEETLGRFAASLSQLPRVLWHTPLNAYCDLTLAEIRALKTHGEKRVTSVIEVFHQLYPVLAGLGSPGSLALRIQTRLIGQVENWLLAVMERAECPSSEELQRQLVMPLVEQVRIDLGEPVITLVEDRLNASHAETSVRQRATDMGLTRARIYQLLGDAADVIAVRWPEGQYLIAHLTGKIRAQYQGTQGYEKFLLAVETLFPHRRTANLVEEPSVETEGDAVIESHRRAG